jgi:hypothetical protein
VKGMDKQVCLNDFASMSLRDTADQDYITARMSYKAHLREPFLWSSLQSIEKYLKAILLFNTVKAKGLSHNLDLAIDSVKRIKDIDFTLTERAESFITYLNNYGKNRYLEVATHLRKYALLDLDHTVWQIRRYCFYMRGSHTNKNGEKINLLPLEIATANHDQYKQRPHSYRVFGGFLEKVIEKRLEAYPYLIWHNFYYGRRHRKKIRNYKWHISLTNPTLVRHPECFDILDEFVQFSKETRRYYSELKANIKVNESASNSI